MAILFVDGCEHSASLTEKGYSNITGTTAYSTTQKRTGSRALACQTTTNSHLFALSCVKTLPGNYATLRAAFGYYLNGSSVPPFGMVTFRDSTTDQVTIRINADMTLSAYRGSAGGTLLGTSTAKIKFDAWNHLEVVSTINNTTGSVDIWLDNVSILSLSSQNTRSTANNYATAVLLGSSVTPASLGGTSANIYSNFFDDIIITDSSSTRIYPAIVQTLYPSGAGTTTQWTASSGANYTTVDETTANSDTDYISTATSGNIDTYAFGDLTALSQTVTAVAINIVARDDAGGTNSIAAMIRSGGTNYAQTSTATTATYTNYQTIAETNPNTSAAWTSTNVNSAEFGVKRI